MKKAIIISVINNKGGVGKTTTTGILAELLAYCRKNVLCVDLDESANLSLLFDCFKNDSPEVIAEIEQPEELNIAELFRLRLREKDKVQSLIRHTSIQGVDIIPSSKRHKNSPTHILSNTGNNNIILKKALETIRSDYDYILIDNAPGSDILTVNSMFACDYVLVPVRTEKFSEKGLKETLESILYIKDEHDLDNANFLGTFITQAEPGTKAYRDSYEEYKESLGDKFLTTPIRKDIKISEMERKCKPILSLNASTNVVFDYATLLLELNILDEEAANMLRLSISEGE